MDMDVLHGSDTDTENVCVFACVCSLKYAEECARAVWGPWKEERGKPRKYVLE